MRLKNGTEIIGKISSVALVKDGEMELSYLFGKRIEIPENAFDFKKLKMLIGKQVGICYIKGQYSLEI